MIIDHIKMSKEKFESLRKSNDFIIELPKSEQHGYYGRMVGIDIDIILDENAIDGFEVIYEELK